MARGGKTKRNVAIAGLGLGLLFLLGAAADEDDDEDEGSPGGQPPPEPDPEDVVPTEVIFVPPEDDWEPPEPGPVVPDRDFAPWVPPGEDPINPADWEHPDNYPTPGKFHQVVWGDMFFGTGSAHNIAWAAIYEAAYQAAVEVGGVDDAEARAFAKSIAGKSSNRGRYTTLIQCSPWNDALYGTWGYKSGKSYPGPHGRAIRMLPDHPPNRDYIMLQRKPPLRNVQMRNPNDKGKGNAGAVDEQYAETWEYLWLPPLNLERLWNNRELTTEGVAWEDGSSVMLPPPPIWNLGIDVLSDPGLDAYGCPGYEEALG